ncbi:MAG: hypothetical protein DHS20C15_16310 [Planctomycetota bacterium]|nr:MAG: hypothetical protein DHS20C15_16310 [Planctomycetota bacterium]
MGLLSLFAPASASDQLESADAVVFARVSAVQVSSHDDLSHVALLVQDRLIGERVGLMQRFELPGKTALRAGDHVLALINSDTRELLGTYQVDKVDGAYVVVESVLGFGGEGLSDQPGQGLEQVVNAFKVRLGMIDADDTLGEVPVDEEISEGSAGDYLEPNNDMANASPAFLRPPAAVTGLNPLMLTGLSITPGDVDFFSFNAPGSTILHAETRIPEGATATNLDTLMGFFDGTTSALVAVDDDSAAGKSSRLILPIERMGTHPYFLAVESAPDSALDFTGSEGTTSGLYELQLELETATYIGNSTDQILGISEDGTFIEDFIGYREVFGEDVLLVGVPGDGWGLTYDIELPSGLTSVFGGSGDFLSPPNFNQSVRNLGFSFGHYTDENGTNRAGRHDSSSFVPYLDESGDGATVRQRYTIGLNQTVVQEAIALKFSGSSRVENMEFSRLLDVDMFGEDGDTFYWSFPANSRVKAFPVSTGAKLGSITAPAEMSGSMSGDLQAVITAGTLPGQQLQANASFRAWAYFTMVLDFATEDDAVQSAAQNLIASGAGAWVVAVDADPETGLFTAFGIGVEEPAN